MMPRHLPASLEVAGPRTGLSLLDLGDNLIECAGHNM
jgi:hypothetical protein